MSENEKAGPKRPPKAYQFKPGQSGNPRGRPKGTRNLGTDLADILGRRVSVREDGKERRISRQEALLLSLYNKALHGDVRAATAIINMLSKLALASTEPPEAASLSESDERILADFLRRRTSVTKANE
jgi:hypothetical protein